MKKSMKFATVAMACAAGVMSAQAANFEVGADLNSAYVWRGQVINNEAVLQPSATVTQENEYGVWGFNVWMNHDLTANGVGSKYFGWSETDYTVFYGWSAGDFDFEVGHIYYQFTSNYRGDDEVDDMMEVYASVSMNNPVVVPSVVAYWEYESDDEVYVNASLTKETEVSEAMTVGCVASLGWGNRHWNRLFEYKDHQAVNDLNLGVTADYALSENVSMGAHITYTDMIGGGAMRDGIWDDSEILWGGVSLTCNF